MKEKVLAPIHETEEDFSQMEYRIQENWKENLYLPLLEMLRMDDPEERLENDASPLIKAIKSGRVRFYRGLFSGKFNASSSKELKELGAKWDRKTKSFRVPYGDLDTEVKQAISLSEDKFYRVMKKLDQFLKKFLPEEIADKVELADLFSTRIMRLDSKIQSSLKGIAIQPDLSVKQRNMIADGYSENLKLYIKDWTGDEIKKLRKIVMKSAVQGNRYESLVKEIQSRYAVSQNKAKFLARQETGILMAKFKEARYVEAGSDEYIWTCVVGSPNHPVRPLHKILDGTRQKWSEPPIVNKKGDRKHPGCDYGCRCTARPVVRF